MPVNDYFSKDVNRRARFVFNLIAPVYAAVDTGLMKYFSRAVKVVDAEISIRGKSILDIGTGTGAWAAVFKRKGAARVHGIDFSERMLARSRKKHPEVSFSNGNAEMLSDFADNAFDVVTASYVLHGVKKDRRRKILLEMKRISKKHVVIHDFSGKTPLFLRFLEFMEKSDYKNFKISFCEELKSLFFEVEKIETGNGSGLYFATTQNE